MKYFTRSLSLIVFFTIGFLSCRNENSNSQGTAYENSLNLNSVNTGFLIDVPKWLKEYNVPAVGIGLIENNTIKLAKVYGELENGMLAPDNAIFNTASITKTIATMLTLKLVENGQWNLDEPLFKYWVDPDVANDPLHKRLTTRHILTHKSGFLNWRRMHKSKKLTFESPPGTKFGYSGEGLHYLQKAIENKFNTPIAVMTDSLLFQPLSMIDTRHTWDENMEESRFALWHDEEGQKYERSNKTYWPGLADDLLTTVEDYCKFGIYTMNTSDHSPALFSEMVEIQSDEAEHSGLGIGWFIIKGFSNEEYAIYHDGSDIGVKTLAIFLPESKRGVVVFTNGDNGDFIIGNVVKGALDSGGIIWDYYNEWDNLEGAISVSESSLQKYTGTYTTSSNLTFVISNEKNKIILERQNFPKSIFYPSAELNKFYARGLDQTIEFLVDELGKIKVMKMRINDKEIYTATKNKKLG